MKYILVLLISFAFGQITIDLEGDGVTKEELAFQMNIVTVTEYPYELWKRMFNEKGLIQVTFEYDDIKIDTYFPTIRSYEIYVEECYNDSTAVTFGYFYSWETGEEYKEVYQAKGGELIMNLKRTEKGYIHTTPTFLGFTEWIKE